MTKTRKRRKLRKFKIQLPKFKRRKLKFRLKKEAWYVIFGVIALLCLLFIPRSITNSKLKKLGYKKDEISAIRQQKLTSTIVDGQMYSPYLASCLLDGSLDKDYLPYYTIVSSERGLDARDFLLIHRLREKGYEEDQIENLIQELRIFEITPLLVFDYQYDENIYINDCKQHPDNSLDSFVLSGNYYRYYGDTHPVDNPGSLNSLVNKTYYLDETFIPENLTDLSIQHAASNRQLASVAVEPFYDWCNAGRNVGVTFYATSAYRSYESQVELYNSYVRAYGEAQTDAVSARPGFSEHQTGLTVDIAATHEDDIDEFKDTLAYQWTSTNSQDYGWILRYPENKETITGYEFEAWHYRYLGKNLAKAVYASGFTYDEFYALYLKPWDSEENMPKDSVLNASDYRNISTEEPEE